MSDKTLRKIRLASALIGVIAGLELCLVNLREYELPAAGPFVETVTNGQGWPFCWRKTMTSWASREFELVYSGLVLDILLAIAICATVAVVSNWMLRTAGQKQHVPQRSLLQLHLSTAVLLALGVGGLLLLNLQFSPGENMPDVLWQSSTIENIYKRVKPNEGSISIGQQYGWVGWPITFRRLIDMNGETYTAMFYDSLLMDCAVALNSIFLIAFISEWMIRRREARKP